MNIDDWYIKNKYLLYELFREFLKISSKHNIDMYKNNNSYSKFLHIIYNNTI